MTMAVAPDAALAEAMVDPGPALCRARVVYYRKTAPYVLRFNARNAARERLAHSQQHQAAQAHGGKGGKGGKAPTPSLPTPGGMPPSASRKRSSSRPRSVSSASKRRAAGDPGSAVPTPVAAEPPAPASTSLEQSAQQQYDTQPADVRLKIDAIMDDASLSDDEKIARIQVFFTEPDQGGASTPGGAATPAGGASRKGRSKGKSKTPKPRK